MPLSSVMDVCFTYVYVSVVVSVYIGYLGYGEEMGGKMCVGGESRIGVLV